VNINNLQPAQAFAVNFGLKAVVYGGPGVGKTPICVTTSPNPVLLLNEAGALTLKGCNVPTWPAFTEPKLDEFFKWFFESAESRKFDTLVWDSCSQGAEIIVDKELGGRSKAGNQPDGRKAYGNMARQMMEYLNKLYFLPQKHVLLICKQGVEDILGMQMARPIMPGKDLNIRLPHLVDNVIHVGNHLGSGVTDRSTFQCLGDMTLMARDRSGKLLQYEPANISHVISKACAA
jgi:hypothetical protein